MPKMRTHAGMKKRFHVTATGAIKRSKPGIRHLAPGKTKNQRRHLRKSGTICTSDRKRISEQLKLMK
jgi:large subunit ribosomal protein L35